MQSEARRGGECGETRVEHSVSLGGMRDQGLMRPVRLVGISERLRQRECCYAKRVEQSEPARSLRQRSRRGS